MNSETPDKIKGGMAAPDLTNDAAESDTAGTHEKLLSYSPCPEEYQDLIEETSLEKLVYWKLSNLFDKFDKESPRDVPSDILRTVLVHVEKPLFALILKNTKGNQSKAAEVLGCNRNTLHRKLKEFAIQPRNLRQALRNSDKKSVARTSFRTHLEEAAEAR